jgi:hypothetical protein
MWIRLRQIALVAHELAPVEQQLRDVLGIEVCYREPGVGHFGLENALLPIGNQLLEVVAPTEDDTAGGRYLERRNGDGGYMVITQCDDHAPRVKQVNELGIRLVAYSDGDHFKHMQMHPKDTGGSFFEIDEQVGDHAHDEDGPWGPAGPDWQKAKRIERVSGIVAAEMQCDDPAKVAARWAEISQLPLGDDNSLALQNAVLRFVECSDGRPEGLSEIDVSCIDRQAIVAAATQRGAQSGESQVTLCGLRINLV